jgi:glycerate 2-kinase
MSGEWADARAQTALRQSFDAATTIVDLRSAVAGNLPAGPKGRCSVVGAGKGSAAMRPGLNLCEQPKY